MYKKYMYFVNKLSVSVNKMHKNCYLTWIKTSAEIAHRNRLIFSGRPLLILYKCTEPATPKLKLASETAKLDICRKVCVSVWSALFLQMTRDVSRPHTAFSTAFPIQMPKAGAWRDMVFRDRSSSGSGAKVTRNELVLLMDILVYLKLVITIFMLNYCEFFETSLKIID